MNNVAKRNLAEEAGWDGFTSASKGNGRGQQKWNRSRDKQLGGDNLQRKKNHSFVCWKTL